MILSFGGKVVKLLLLCKMTWFYMIEIKTTKAMLYHVIIAFNNILYHSISKYNMTGWYKQYDNIYKILAYNVKVVDLCQKVSKVSKIGDTRQ